MTDRRAHLLEAARPYLRQRIRKELEAGRSDLAEVAAAILALVEVATRKPEPVKFRRPVPDTVPGDFSPTAYVPQYARTELATIGGPL